jgi:hypothetical protein
MIDYQRVLEEGSWFWGRTSFFVTHWFLYFYPSIMYITKMIVWVYLPNLPLHFWHLKVLHDIINFLATYIKTNLDRIKLGLFTYVEICVEIGIDAKLLDKIILHQGDFHWVQTLDYEHVIFQCRFYQQPRNIQVLCLHARSSSTKNKGHKPILKICK